MKAYLSTSLKRKESEYDTSSLICLFYIGISLTVEQWTRLKEQIDEIDEAVKEFS